MRQYHEKDFDSQAHALRLVRDTIRQQPPIGTIHLRKELHDLELAEMIDFKWDGHPVHITRNYRCHPPYSEDQRIEHLGYTATVWAKNEGYPRIASGPLERVVDVLSVLNGLAKEADAKCGHLESETIVSTRRGYHQCRCLNCGIIFEYDSSD